MLAVPVAQLGKHQRGERVQGVARRHRQWVGEIGNTQLPHCLGLGVGPPVDPGAKFVVVDVEDGADQSPGLAGRLDEGDVLEATLHLGPLAALVAASPRQVIFERQVLKCQHEYGKARTLARLSELL